MTVIKTKNPAAVSLGRMGGVAGRGQCKNRGRDHYQRISRERWDRVQAQAQAVRASEKKG